MADSAPSSSDSPFPTIAVYGVSDAEVDALARAIRDAAGWRVVAMPWPDDATLRAARGEGAGVHVVVGDAPDLLIDALAGRPRSMPLLFVGGALRMEASPSAWLPSLPRQALVEPLFAQLVGRAAPAARKRKSDLIIGRSPAIRNILRTLDRVASATAPVLVTGESGTGKELVARALHYSGPRSGGAFIAVNCAAIPSTLFESELFGHVRGAFTGAATARAGLFESADGGTLFLDEIGELPLAMQGKLLRVLETGEVTRLGSSEVRHTNVRIVAATHRALEAEVEASRFRADLYYRIRVIHVTIPPLRERPEDIPPLVSHALSGIASRNAHPVSTVTSAAMERLLRHRWPGNVRELVNCLERAVVHALPGGAIDAGHILLGGDEAALVQPFREARDAFEGRYYTQLLRAADGNVSMAAKLAKRTRAQVYDALRRLALDPSTFRDGDAPRAEEGDEGLTDEEANDA